MAARLSLLPLANLPPLPPSFTPQACSLVNKLPSTPHPWPNGWCGGYRCQQQTGCPLLASPIAPISPAPPTPPPSPLHCRWCGGGRCRKHTGCSFPTSPLNAQHSFPPACLSPTGGVLVIAATNTQAACSLAASPFDPPLKAPRYRPCTAPPPHPPTTDDVVVIAAFNKQAAPF